jgi:hypothetical protein
MQCCPKRLNCQDGTRFRRERRGCQEGTISSFCCQRASMHQICHSQSKRRQSGSQGGRSVSRSGLSGSQLVGQSAMQHSQQGPQSSSRTHVSSPHLHLNPTSADSKHPPRLYHSVVLPTHPIHPACRRLQRVSSQSGSMATSSQLRSRLTGLCFGTLEARGHSTAVLSVRGTRSSSLSENRHQ